MACVTCGAETTGAEETCGVCSARPPQPPLRPAVPGWSPRAERRQLTIMFCDLVGSTELASRIDPEDLLEIVGRYRQAIATAVKRWGGFVAQFLGDGVMVYFGWPKADEADAENSVRAAIAVLDAVARLAVDNKPLRVRIGIASGLVVIGAVPGPTGVPEASGVGEAPNVASRLQEMAEPGCIVVDNATRIRFGEVFACEDLGTIVIKGRPDPAHAWRVLNERPIQIRQEALRAGQRGALVGRDEEIDLLYRHWLQAKRGEGRIVQIVGEPGIGKSRLLRALLERLESEPHAKLRFYCLPHQTDSELQPIIANVEHAAKFDRSPSASEKLRRLAEMFSSAEMAGNAAEIAVLAGLFGLTDESLPALQISPQRRRERTFDALLRHLERLTKRQPLLLLFEDMQWSDPTTLELVDRSIAMCRRLPVLFLTTFRPEFAPRWTGRAGVSQIQLRRLEPRHSAVLIDRIAGGEQLPTLVRDRIAAQTDGVPLFIEELTKAVIENRAAGESDGSSAGAYPVPATLQSSLMARLDRLAEAKEIAQIGSVIGRSFAHAMIAAVARLPENDLQARLNQLIAAELVFAEGEHPDTKYVFKHILVQEIAYESLLRHRRAELHAGTFAALLKLQPELEETQPALLGHHCAQAGLVEKAAAYYRRAGERSAERAALAETRAQLERGLSLFATGPPNAEQRKLEVELKLAFGRVLLSTQGNASEEAGRFFSDAVAKSRPSNDIELLTRSLWGCWFNLAHRRELTSAEAIASELLGFAEKRGDLRARHIAHAMIGVTCFWQGHFDRARDNLAAAHDLARANVWAPVDLAIVSTHLSNHVAMQLSLTLACCGLFGRAAESAEELARTEPAHLPSRAILLSIRCRYATFLRADPMLRASATALMALSEEQGFPFYVAHSRIYLGWLAAKDGHVEHGLDMLAKGLASLETTDAVVWQPHFKALMAEAQMWSGRPAAALSLLHDAAEFSRLTGGAWCDAEIQRVTGQVLRQRGAKEQPRAEACFRKAIDISQSQGGRLFELRAVTSLAELLSDQGRRSEARSELGPILASFSGEPQTGDIKNAIELLAVLGPG